MQILKFVVNNLLKETEECPNKLTYYSLNVSINTQHEYFYIFPICLDQMINTSKLKLIDTLLISKLLKEIWLSLLNCALDK